MPIFRDDVIVVVAPGSQTTLATIGLTESLTPPSIEIPTRVYQKDKSQEYFSSKGEESEAVYPIQHGRIVNLAAFNYLLKLIYKLAKQKLGEMTHIPLIVFSGNRWTRLQIEHITQYAFETMNVAAFSIVPNALAATFAYGLADSLVVDIGYETTEITPVNEFMVVEHAKKVIDYGGQDINVELKKLLPKLSDKQIEELKRSHIYEVLNEDDTKNSWFALNAAAGGEREENEEDGVVDIAAIVSSGRAREILDERERAKKSGEKHAEEPPNKDREYNDFVDSDGEKVHVGEERFHGTENLVSRITEAVGDVIKKIDQVNKRQDCWDNVIIVGQGSSVKGLKEALYVALQSRYVILRSTTYSEVPSTFNTGTNTPNNGTPLYTGMMHAPNQGHGQAPTSIRIAKMADYFPEWKGYGWENAPFLGGQIAAKQIFSGSIDSMFVSRSEYNEVGPAAIWDI
ncbi:actin-like protein Arp9p [Trichomonascus vanleenenianus]|uniref:Arp9p n=1 Tax=Trichomonascus vanleenenianus TaxID=2268995 RepID=UPI003ECA3A5A